MTFVAGLFFNEIVYAQALNTSGSLNTSGGLNISGSISGSGGISGSPCLNPGFYYLSNGHKVYYNGDGTYFDTETQTYGGTINSACGNGGSNVNDPNADPGFNPVYGGGSTAGNSSVTGNGLGANSTNGSSTTSSSSTATSTISGGVGAATTSLVSDPIGSGVTFGSAGGFTPGVPNTGSGGNAKNYWMSLITLAAMIIGAVTYIKNQIAIR